ncbi:hypothetical protein DMA11_03805 [Marinilabiliaceae bacterium JC017]|nr:hypothetical protein DMA11_03805 [Marinilabiliaceae bacterium JC017]
MKKGYLFIIACTLFFIWSCANQGFPEGGPKDETPPRLKKSTPAPNALNYQDKEIILEFNELIQLKDVSQKFVISPPLNEQPIIDGRGSQVRVNIDEDLQPNTTYTLDFADAIVDNNEGNVLPNFRFSFSTGEVVDSLSVSGHLWEAEDLSPADGVFVFLHENLSDTAFQTRVPVRLAKTNAQGYFSIRNVRPGRYRIYALGDTNNNFKFDQPGERIGWSDVIIDPSYEYRQVTDTITPDSVLVYDQLFYLPDSLQLFLFQEDYKQQYLSADERKEKAKLSFVFNRSLEEDLKIWLTGHEKEEAPFIIERSFANDSVTAWINDSTLYNQDSISVTLEYPVRDSLFNLVSRTDTIAMYFFEVKEKKKKKRKKKGEEEEIPHINIKGLPRSLDPYKALTFSLPAPATLFDESAILLTQKIDTLFTPVEFEFWQDSMNIRNYYIMHNWEPGATYEVAIDSAAIRDIYDLVNKPVKNSFSIKELESYGILYLQINNPQKTWLVQVLDTKEQIIQESYLPSNGKIAFQYLKPGDYMLKIVDDINENGRWDAGSYGIKVQPEKVMYYPDKITIRANWDYLQEWDPTTFDIYDFSQRHRKPSSSKQKK